MLSARVQFACLYCLASATALAADEIDFARDIRPILIEHCYTCHGPDAGLRQAGLRLDLRSGATSRLESGRRAVVPGRPAESELWRRITHADPAERMPPPEGKPLSDQQRERLKKWIQAGAPWPDHWSFVPPRASEPRGFSPWPKGNGQESEARGQESGFRNRIDVYVRDRLAQQQWQPAPQADRLTLLRRVTLDLTGIVPTASEIDEYLADNFPDAYERTVDRLLASPRYGERMASDWLDAARYGDTHGYHSDSQREMWRWRDWVIDAFNANMPFDQFTIEQLAGDLLPGATLSQRIATGFHRNHMLNDENGAIPEEYLCEYISDRVTTTATVWLGLTIGCARCHDHKYDPLSQRDFYRLYAFFHNVPENGLGGRSGNAPPVIIAPTRLQQDELDKLAALIAALETNLTQRASQAARDQAAWEAQALAKTGALNRPPQDAAVHVTLDGAEQDGAAGVTLKGNPTFAEGKFGKALLCDGETFAEVPRNALGGHGLERSDRFTIALWVFATTGDRTALVASVDETLAGRGVELALADDRLHFRLTHLPQKDELLVRTAEKLPRSKWRHVAVAADGTGKAAGVTIYIDGRPQPVEVVHDTLAGHVATDQPIRIGRGDSETLFRGKLDDVQIFARTLSAAEIGLLVGGDPIQELLRVPPAERTPDQQAVIQKYYLENHDAAYREILARLTEARRRQSDIRRSAPTVMVMQELPQPRDTFVLKRGRYDQPQEKVTSGTPEILPPLPGGWPRNRLGLAMWLVQPDHPLTSRVTVNRYWQLFFGTGLVKTADDFGTRGEMPSHPELLDWLAVEFARAGQPSRGASGSPVQTAQSKLPSQRLDNSGSTLDFGLRTWDSPAWDLKRLCRLMVTSATYRQSSRVTPEHMARDPDNRLLARGPRGRLPAEAIRDSALAASGLLDRRIGGPSVRPYQPADLWKELAYNPLEYTAQSYVESRGGDLYRRSLYTFWKRTVPPPAMSVLDAPDREVCTVSRGRTSTPLAALVLLNDPTYVEAARHLAQRAMRYSPDDRYRLQRLVMLVLTRPPRPEEASVLLAQLSAERQDLANHRQRVSELLAVGQSPADPSLDELELAAWTTVASVILNLDEAVTNH
jgi:hypothetical protein